MPSAVFRQGNVREFRIVWRVVILIIKLVYWQLSVVFVDFVDVMLSDQCLCATEHGAVDGSNEKHV